MIKLQYFDIIEEMNILGDYDHLFLLHNLEVWKCRLDECDEMFCIVLTIFVDASNGWNILFKIAAINSMWFYHV